MIPASRVILAIENSNPSAIPAVDPGLAGWCGIAIGRYTADSSLEGGSMDVLAVEPIRQRGREADGLMPAIASAVQRAGLVPSDIQQVAVSVGPGGYTAVRMACAAGAMIAHAAGASCSAVPSAWVVAASAYPKHSGVRFGIALAGKDDSAHLTVVEPSAHWRDLPDVAQEVGIIRAGDMHTMKIHALFADRFLPEQMRTAAMLAGIEVIEPVFDAVACLWVSTVTKTIKPAELLPIYPREPDAVTLWRARHH